MTITFVSAWYQFKSKFDATVYKQWMTNLLHNVHQFNLIIFTDAKSKPLLDSILLSQTNPTSPNIRIIVKEHTKFHTYPLKEEWIENHKKNTLLNQKTEWKVHMLWSEKIAFVKETMDRKYFDTEFYGWCDIGYFRCGTQNMPYEQIKDWPNPGKIFALDPHKIYYCQVCPGEHLERMFYQHMPKTEYGLPLFPIDPSQISIAGGFFIVHKNKVNWWFDTFYLRLKQYFRHQYLVKDDQILIIDCILNHFSEFQLIQHITPYYDPWFGFQTFLL